MSQLHGKQLRNESTSLNKLNGTGIVSFENATMSFVDGAVLTTADSNINNGTDVVNKNYVDSLVQGLDIKESVKVKFDTPVLVSDSSAVVLEASPVILTAGDRVLLNGQNGATASPDNGIWVVGTGTDPLTRPDDFIGTDTVTSGAFTFVEEGDFADSGFVLITDGEIEVGETPIKFVQFSGAGQITAGDGLTKTGNTLDVNIGTGLQIDDFNNVRLSNTNVDSGNYGSASSVPVFTVDAQGRLTEAANTAIEILSSAVSDFDSASETAIFDSANFVYSDTIDFTVTEGESVKADVKIDGAASGLTVSTDGISVNVDGVTIIVNNDGELEVDSSTIVPDVSNGLSTNIAGDIVLGGTLSAATTTINADSNDLIFTNMNNFTIAQSDEVTIDDVEIFSLSFGTGSVTSTSLEGLVYTDDYTGTFVTNSLITKQYVDSAIDNSTYFAGDGLELNGLTFSIDPASAGTGLTYTSGVFNVNLGVNSGLTFSGDNIIVDTNIAGNGLDITNGVLSVNTSEITSDLAGAGLTADGGELDILLDSDALEFNSSNQVSLKTTIIGGRTFSNSVTFSDSVTIGDNLLVSGDFTVSGTTTFINTTELEVTDNIITLAAGQNTGVVDAGIKVDRGSDPQARLLWDESENLWVAGLTGSELAIFTEAGTGLTSNGNVVSIDTTGFTGDLAGNGLTANGGELDVNVDTTSIVITNDVLGLAPTVSNGVTFSGNFLVSNGGTINNGLTVSGGSTTDTLTVTGTSSFTGLVTVDGITGSSAFFTGLQTSDAPVNGDDVINLTYFGASYSQLQVQIDSIDADFITAIEVGPGLTVSSPNEGTASIAILDTTAGDGLSFSNGVYDVNTSNGLTIISDSVQIADTAAGDGLTFSSGVFDVNTGLGLTISGDDVAMVWGGTSTGLTFSNDAVKANVDGSTIIINGSGQLAVSIDGFKAEPVYDVATDITTTGSTGSATGLTLSATPSQYSRVQVFVNGLNVNVAKVAADALTSAAYFQNGSIRDLNNLDTDCELYWNSSVALYQLEEGDLVEIVYEA
jgi:hypothetical protein